MESGRIRRLAIHGDTKLDNFLFSTRTGRVKALVDLDTIMPHTWLADWGDMVRSLVNVAGEKERDLSRVQVDMDVYRAVARGFLSTARRVTPAEVGLMADAPQIIALELGLRFLLDYLRGDSYFKLGPADPPDLNGVRAMAQLSLFRRLRERADEARRLDRGPARGVRVTMALRELKIGASGVRGVVGDALTPELVVNFACAFGTWCGGGPVVIGRDTRRSSPALRAAVVSGLLSTGCRVVDLGVCPSPLVSFAIRDLGASGGIAITGSHNDASWNALKFFGPDGALLNAAKNEELLDVYHGAAFELATWDRLKPVDAAPDVEERYLEYLASALDVDPIRERGFRVAVDFTNGACGAIAARFLESLHCTLLPVNAGADGRVRPPSRPHRREHAPGRRPRPAASAPTWGRPSTWTATGSGSSPGRAPRSRRSIPCPWWSRPG